ncbi:hypothetical protein ACZ90_29015 [Streptomyces albus subsp. albus]|nr:hypothetical protein ACZ90_29015 [Streptomyces albus subsp. albus]
MRNRRVRPGRFSFTALLAAVLLAVPAGTATAAQSPVGAGSTVAAAQRLGNVQTGLSWAGVRPGSYVTGWLRYPTVQAEISAQRPIETRIQWSSGGGHMHVIYGYDDANNWVYWGDPWPSSDRYNWASHAWYVNNNEFSWTHSLYRIGA